MDAIDITPNPKKTMESFRYLTYSNETALADIVDNSLDADSDIVWVDIAEDRIIIADIGCGMDEDTLAEAIKIGSDTEKDGSKLGKFGMGLVMASISIARKLTVYSKTLDTEFHGVCLDLDKIAENNIWKAEHVEPSEEFRKDFLKSELGTIVVLENIDHYKYKSVNTLVEKVTRHFGEVFRKFIDAGRQIYVNGKLVEAIDPLALDADTTNVIVDEDVDYNDTVLHITAVEVNSDGSNLTAESKTVNPANQGFYFLRNNRQVARAVAIGNMVKHPSLNRFRCEVSFSSDLDDQVGINFTKDRVEIKQSLSDKIMEKAQLCMNICRKNSASRKSAKEENEKMDHSDAEKIIERKRTLLPKPTLWKELRTKHTKKPTVNPPVDDPKEEGEEQEKRKREHAKKTQLGYRGMHARFEQANDTESSTLFSYDNEGSDIVIRWNVRHPFYAKFVAPFNNDKNVSSPIDLWAFSIALAELQSAEDGEQSEKFLQLREEYSRILRTLMS